MLNTSNPDFKRVLQKVGALKKYKDKHFNDLTVCELNDYYDKCQVLIDYVLMLEEGLKQKQE